MLINVTMMIVVLVLVVVTMISLCDMTMMIMMIIITFCALDILILEFLPCKWQLVWNMLIKIIIIIIKKKKFQPDEEAEIPHVIGPHSPSFLSCNYLYSRTSLCFHLGLFIYSLSKHKIHPPYNRNKKKSNLFFSILVILAKRR